ncbi:hypothetical protein DFS34DRAFT_630104 [Phlyctochytrium arcticum]|nr:hypothetical protein DFS34DRAFT_630104 [Phlyctochytrium arcticum]
MSEKLGGKTQIGPSTPEFGALEYELQLALQASTARIVAAHSLSNPHLNVQFEKRCRDILVLSSWMDASLLAGVNTEEDVIRRGFQFPPGQHGMKFSVGAFSCPSSSSDRKNESRTLRKALLCRVGVGRAFAANESHAESMSIPGGYDSLYLKDQSAKRDTKDSANTYRHEYYIKDTAQILPIYLIHYEYDPSKERKSRERANCDNCEEQSATVFCTADAANLCNKCDAQLHVSKLASRHVRTPIGKGSNVFGHCRHHPEKLIEFFCSQCHIPVCVSCKMVGNHASGEASKHQLVSVSEAYTSVLQEAQTHDPILQERRTEIINQIAAVNSRAKAVEKMGTQIETQIEEMYKRAMNDLRHIVQKKLTILLGDELDLERQLGEIERLEDFLRYQQDGDATTFLFNWSKHQQCRADLHDVRHFRNQIDVQLDAKITGNISIVIDHDRAAVAVSGIPPPGRPMKPAQNLGSPVASTIGKGLPRSRLQGRRTHRRISDFFAETLGSFDQLSTGHLNDDEDDDDDMSEVSAAAAAY